LNADAGHFNEDSFNTITKHFKCLNAFVLFAV